MKLVSFASELTEKELESKYRKLCQRDPENAFGFEEISPDDADEFLEGCFVQDDNQEDPAFKLLGSLQRESVLVDPRKMPQLLTVLPLMIRRLIKWQTQMR